MFVLVVITLCAFLYNSADSFSTYDQRQNGDMNVQIDLKNFQIIALMKGGKEEYVDYDYAYDYSEMTIKPTNGTTPKPLNATNTVIIETDNVNNSAPAASATHTDAIIKTTTNPEQTVTEPYLSQTKRNETVLGQSQTNEADENNPSGAVGAGHSTKPIDTTSVQSDLTNIGHDLNLTYQTTTVISIEQTNQTNTSDTNIDVVEAISAVAPDLANNVTSAAVNTTKCRRGFVQNGEGKCEYKVHGTTNALRRIVKLAQKIKIGRKYKEISEDSTENI